MIYSIIKKNLELHKLLNSSKGINKSIYGEFDYPNYSKLQDIVNTNYNMQYKNYPNTMALLDLAFRLKLADEFLDYEKIIESHTKFNYKTYFYRIYLILLTKILPKKSKKQLYYNLPNFNFVESVIVDFCQKNNYIHKSKNTDNRFKLFFEIFLLKRPTYNFILSSPKSTYFFSQIRKHGIDLIIQNEHIMNNFENVVNKEIDILKRMLLFFNIKHLITLGDQDKDSLLAIAAKDLGINYVVFAHGYISSSSLLSILPLNASKLILWTKQQLEDLKRVVDTQDIKKLHFIGFPKIHKFSKKKLTKISKVLLILTGPLESMATENMLEDNNFINNLNILYTNFNKIGIEIITRLHPKDQNNISTITKFKSLFPYNSNNLSIEKTFDIVDCVIGYDSSVLIESKMNGIQTFQIDDFMNIEFKNIEILKINEIKHFNKNVVANVNYDFELIKRDFYNNLNMVLS